MARSAVVLALVGSLLAPAPAAAPQDGSAPDPQLITDAWTYAADTEEGYDHVLRWMRVLKTLGALEDMTVAEAQGNADQHLAARWDPVVEELGKLQAQGGYQPASKVVSDVWGYAREITHGFDHMLRWMRVLKTFGALEDMTAAEARGYADSGWEGWGPVADELAELEAAEPEESEEESEEEAAEEEESEEEGVSGDQGDEPADPEFSGVAVTFFIAEDHDDGAPVGTVAATDANGDTLTYSLSGADAASFSLNTATGEISVASGVQLDFEAQEEHSVTVGVSDGNDADGSPEATPTTDATIAVTIGVIDVDDEELRTSPQMTVPMGCGAEEASTGKWFESVTATATLISVEYAVPRPNLDSGSFNVCGPHGADDAYVVRSNPDAPPTTAGTGLTWGVDSINGLSGAAVLLKPDTDYWVRVIPSSTAYTGPSSLWTHVRTLPGSPDPPQGCGDRVAGPNDQMMSLSATSSSITVGWLRVGNAEVRLCRATGPNMGERVSAGIVSTSGVGRGEVTVTRFGSGESAPALTASTEYWVMVHGYTFNSKWHYIRTLAAGPVAPVFTDGASTTLSMQEGHADGASVGTVGATDGNGDTLTYSLSGTHASSFTINSSTGEISVAAGVNLLHTTTYMVTVSVGDGKNADGGDESGTPGVDATIAVTIEVTEALHGPVAPVVTVSAPTPVSVDVSWVEPTDLGASSAVTDYDVRYFAGDADPSNEENWVTADEVHGLRDPGTDTTATILGLTASTAYRVQVRAIGDVDPTDGEWSASATVTTPAAVANPRVLVANFRKAQYGIGTSGPNRAPQNNARVTSSHDYATEFTTGNNADGYRLDSVEIFFTNASGNTTGHATNVYLATGLPSATTVVAKLAGPARIRTQGPGVKQVFTAPAGTTLAANTNYWVVMEPVTTLGVGDTNLRAGIARETTEDDDPRPESEGGDGDHAGLTDWSIADRGFDRTFSSTGAWTARTIQSSPSSTVSPLLFRVHGTVVDDLIFVSLSVAGDELTFTFSRDLDATSKPAASAFPVTVNGTDRTVTGVEISGKQVILTLASPTFSGDTMTVAYNKPTENPLKDSANEEADSLDTQTFTVTARVTGVEITSSEGTYGGGAPIRVSVTFSEPVNVDTSSGRPSIGLDFRTDAGIGDNTADYKAGSGTNTLIFEYRVITANSTANEGVAGDGQLAGAQQRHDHHRAGRLGGATGPRRSAPRHRPPGERQPDAPPGEQLRRDRLKLHRREGSGHSAGVHHRPRRERLRPHRLRGVSNRGAERHDRVAGDRRAAVKPTVREPHRGGAAGQPGDGLGGSELHGSTGDGAGPLHKVLGGHRDLRRQQH